MAGRFAVLLLLSSAGLACVDLTAPPEITVCASSDGGVCRGPTSDMSSPGDRVGPDADRPGSDLGDDGDGAVSELDTADHPGPPPADAPLDSPPPADAGADAPPDAPPDTAVDAAPDTTSPLADASPDAAPDSRPPLAVSFTGYDLTAQKGNSSASPMLNDDRCPAGQALIGFAGNVADNFIAAVSGRCGTVTVIHSSTGPSTVRVSSAAQLPQRGGAGTAWTRLCPADQVVRGFEGRSGLFVDQLVIRCATLSFDPAGDGSIVVGAGATLASIGGNGGTAFAPVDCADGRVAIGAITRANVYVDLFGLGCGSPAIAP